MAADGGFGVLLCHEPLTKESSNSDDESRKVGEWKSKMGLQNMRISDEMNAVVSRFLRFSRFFLDPF